MDKLIIKIKRGSYWIGALILIIALTWINNHYYYASRDITVKAEEVQYLRLLQAHYRSCRTGQSDTDCLNQLTDLIKHASPKGTLSFSDTAGEHIIFNNQYYAEKRTKVSSSLVISEENAPLIMLTYSQYSSPDIHVSVLRSISFSIADICERWQKGEDTDGFIENVAIPRSRPFVLYGLFIFFAMGLAYADRRSIQLRFEETQRKEQSLREKIWKIQDKAIQADLERDKLLEKIEDNTREILTTQEQIAQLQQQKSTLEEQQSSIEINLQNEQLERNNLEQELSITTESKRQTEARLRTVEDEMVARNTEIRRLMQKLDNASELHKQLKSSHDTARTEIDHLRLNEATLKQQYLIISKEKQVNDHQGQSQNWRQRLLNVLLDNPKVAINTKSNKVNPGRHHSNNFVMTLFEAISSTPQLDGLYQAITSIAYNPHKRGKADIKYDQSKKRYVLNVYDGNGDEGFGAQIVLSATKPWEAVVESKCLVETVSFMNQYRLNDCISGSA